jgi:hypothetical protein
MDKKPYFREDIYTVRYAVSQKEDPIVQGNHHGPTRYYREEVEVTADAPNIVYYYSESRGPGSYTHTYHTSQLVSSPSDWSYPTGYIPKLNNEAARCNTVARSRFRNDDRSFNTSVSVAEAKQTAEMLATTAGQMAHAIKNFRRRLGTLPRGKRALALATAGAWLQGYYGWGSLARDAFDLYGALSNNLKEPLLIKSSCTGSVEMTTTATGARIDVNKWLGTVKVGCTASIQNSLARSMDEWGLINPLTVAWEIVPFSFCVDWLIPIGNTLDSLTATAGLKFEHGYISTVTNCHRTKDTLPAKQISGTFIGTWQQLGHYEVRIKEFSRGPLTSFPPPRLYANQNPFSTPRIVSGAALVVQAVVGRFTGPTRRLGNNPVDNLFK